MLWDDMKRQVILCRLLYQIRSVPVNPVRIPPAKIKGKREGVPRESEVIEVVGGDVVVEDGCMFATFCGKCSVCHAGCCALASWVEVPVCRIVFVVL